MANLIGLLSELPANSTWGTAKSQIGNPTEAQVANALHQLGVSSAHIKSFLSGRETTSQVLAQATSMQAPSPLEAAGLGAGAGLAGFGLFGGGIGGAAGEEATIGAGDSAAGGAAGGGVAGGAASLLSKLAGNYGGAALFLPLLAWLTTTKNWVRVLEFIAGAFAIGFAMRELAK